MTTPTPSLLTLARTFDSLPLDDLAGRLEPAVQIEELIGDRRDDFDRRFAALIDQYPDLPWPAEALLRGMGLISGDGGETFSPMSRYLLSPCGCLWRNSQREVWCDQHRVPEPAAAPAPTTLLDLANAFDEAPDDLTRSALGADITALLGPRAQEFTERYEAAGAVAATATLCEMGLLILPTFAAVEALQSAYERVTSGTPVDWVDIVRRIQRDLLAAIRLPELARPAVDPGELSDDERATLSSLVADLPDDEREAEFQRLRERILRRRAPAAPATATSATAPTEPAEGPDLNAEAILANWAEEEAGELAGVEVAPCRGGA